MKKYKIVDYDDNNFLNRLLKFKGILNKKEDLLNDNYIVDKNQPALLAFKEALLANKDKKFFIVGDYDCDGITATTIIKRLFTFLKIEHNYYLPSRYKDGYGLSSEMVLTAYHNNFDAILCLDNGVSAFAALQKAKELKLSVFIIDHHEYSAAPDVVAFLHPFLLKDGYRDCCTAGLAYLLLSLFKEDELCLCYAGMGTIADVVEVFGYNRYLIKEAIKCLNANIAYALDVLKDTNAKYDEKLLAFQVIPKLNSISRLEGKANVNMLIPYLLADIKTIDKTAKQIIDINKLRKKLTKDMLVLAKTKEVKGEVLCYIDKEFNEGLCGILAGHLASENYKPTICLAQKDDYLLGSGRSPIGYNLYEALFKCKDLFTSFGGHELAVGLKLPLANKDAFLTYLTSIKLVNTTQEEECLLIDEQDLNISNVAILEKLKPYGQGFKEPIFALKKPEVINKYLLKDLYPKFILNNNLEAISFCKEHFEKVGNYWLGYLERDKYKANKCIFRIIDIIDA